MLAVGLRCYLSFTDYSNGSLPICRDTETMQTCPGRGDISTLSVTGDLLKANLRSYPRFCPASLVKLDVHLSLYLLKSTKHFIKIFLRWHFIIALEGISEFQIPEVTGTLSSDCIYQARFKIWASLGGTYWCWCQFAKATLTSGKLQSHSTEEAEQAFFILLLGAARHLRTTAKLFPS